MESIEIYVVMDEEGNYEVGRDIEHAQEQAGELSVGRGTVAVRVVKLTVNMDRPAVAEVEIEVPADYVVTSAKVA